MLVRTPLANSFDFAQDKLRRQFRVYSNVSLRSPASSSRCGLLLHCARPERKRYCWLTAVRRGCSLSASLASTPNEFRSEGVPLHVPPAGTCFRPVGPVCAGRQAAKGP